MTKHDSSRTLVAATHTDGSADREGERGLSASALRFLADVSRELNATLEYETTLANVARLAIPFFADWCTVDMLEADGAIVRLATAAADAQKERILRDLYRLYPVEANASHPITVALRTGEAHWDAALGDEWLIEIARDDAHLALLRRLKPVSAVVVPLIARGEKLGALTFAFGESGRHYRAEDVPLAGEIAHRAALAIDNARLYREAQAEIAARRMAEGELRFRTSLLEAQSEASVEGILVVSPDRRMIAHNRRFLDIWRLDPAMVAGDSSAAAESVMHLVVDPEPMKAVTAHLYAHPDETGRDQIALTDGRTIERHGAPIRGADGVNYGRIWFYRDITERIEAEAALRRAKEEAERADRAKSEFLSRMSHELRTPLNAIIGFAEVMELDPQTSEKQRERLKHILKGGRHLLGLINEVLDIARIESGSLSLSPEPVAVADLVYESLDLSRPLAARRDVRLYVEQPDGFEHHVHADAQRLKQVLLNLLANGVKYNHTGGSVHVSGEERPEGVVRIAVRDSGPGIPTEQLDRLFAPFERLGAERSGVEGAGLGLAIAKRLVEAMGGRIGVESVVGAGSTFWVELPKADRPLRGLVADEGALVRFGAAAPDARATVLYIEDNLANLELMEHVLAFRPGVRLLPAITGGLGLSLALDHRPDLILLDLNLPDVQGVEVLRRLSGDPRTRETPVIVISADASEHQVKRLLAGGARAYLTKPLDVRRLLDVLEQHL